MAWDQALKWGKKRRKSASEGSERVWGGIKMKELSRRKNVMSLRELFCPDPLAGFEKMAGFQIFFCLKIKCFHS